MKYFILTGFCILWLYIIFGCSTQNNENESLNTINLEEIITKEQIIPLSSYANDIEYVPLETKDECLISVIEKLYITDEYILISSDKNLFLFQRNSGKFIRKIGTIGKGPEEYSSPAGNFLNPYNNKIYTYGSYLRNIVKVFSLEGEYIESFSTPEINEKVSMKNYPISEFIDSSTFIGYIENSTGNISKRIVIFTKQAEKASYPQYNKWPSDHIVWLQRPIFFSWGNNLSFKEKSNDTVFYITPERLIPRFVMHTGKWTHPYSFSTEELQEEGENPKDYLYITNMFENEEFLFFYLVYKNEPVRNKQGIFHLVHKLCILNKNTREVIVSKNDGDPLYGIMDDINEFMPVLPITISGNNELVSILMAPEVVQWRRANQAKLSELKALSWLTEVSELDNPVIVSAKLK